MKNRIMETVPVALALILMLAMAVGCLPKQMEASPGQIIFQDQLGRTIKLDGVPERVAAAIKPFPYIFFAVVGNAPYLVGANPASLIAFEEGVLHYMYPELKNANTAWVDTSFVVNVEELLKLKPEVVFQWSHMPDEIAKMEAAGLTVVALRFGTVEHLEAQIRIIGTMFNKEERAESLIKYFQESVNKVAERIKTLSPEDHRRIMILHGNMRVRGRDFSEFWVKNSGAVNVAEFPRFADVNMEQVLKWNPEIIYISHFTDIQPSDLLQNRLVGQDWSAVRAVQNRRVYKIPSGGYRWDPPGVETPLMVKWLATIQHPYLFADMDMRKEVREFFQKVYNFTLTEEMLNEILGDIQD